jgi:S-adenosylmethionine:tRNA ribosyltransferase-isomerase
MRVDLLAFELPPERIAQHPAEDRESARLLVLPTGDAPFEHRLVRDLPDVIPAGALVVVNDTRVIPARLQGQKASTGGRVEIFLVKKLGVHPFEVAPGDVREVESWRALGKASKALRFGSDIEIGPLTARLLGRSEEDGLLEVAIWRADGGAVDEGIRAHGHVPLPPYIKREDSAADQERYQTVFARVDGAIAAPTAGLHVTRAMLGRLAVKGCELATVTLHVGLGTFQPVTVDDLDQHKMHSEWLQVSKTTADAIAKARAEGRPVVAVGTTVVRALESAADPERPGHVVPFTGETQLLIQPGRAFQVVDALFTNFHLPKSTLLALVCAFGGRERVLAAYNEAVAKEYRFYSYGDAMYLAGRAS